MGYSKSKQSVERVRPLLELVLASEGKIYFPTKHPDKLTYAVREALSYAKTCKGDDAKYSIILDKFRIRAKADKILFEPRVTLEYQDPIQEIAESLEMMEVGGEFTHLEIVGACIKHKAPLMKFPDTVLDGTELEFLRRWTNKNNYEINSLTPLVLRKNVITATQDDSTIQ